MIFDRDGTLASVKWCAPIDRSNESWRVFNGMLPFDPVVPEIAALLRSVRPGVERIMVSGRMAGDHQGDTHRYLAMMSWVVKHDLPIDHLFMREGGDFRVDSIVKKEIYHRWIEPYYDVRLVVDDRPQVIEMWRDLGLHVISVQDPGIDPPWLTEGSSP